MVTDGSYTYHHGEHFVMFVSVKSLLTPETIICQYTLIKKYMYTYAILAKTSAC